MKLLLLVSMVLCSVIHSYAESAIEMNVNGIVYRLKSSNKTAGVVGLNSNISDINILDSIEYNKVVYRVTEILEEAFASQYNVVSVRIPDSVVEIGYKSFWSCRNLKNVIWGESIETIGNSAFGQCSSLREAILPNSIKIIGAMAFIGCNNLETINIPNSIAEICSSAFDKCENLSKVFIDNLANYCSASNYHTDIFSSNASLYSNGNLITDLIIPKEVKIIEAMAFCGCGSLESVTFPETLKSIGSFCFERCPNLKEINIHSIVEIGSWCFGHCPHLKTINVHSEIPPTIESDIFYESYPEYMTLHVPHGTKEIYENANGWKDFGTIIDNLPSNESGIENISIDNTQPIYIYNLNGVCVFSGIGNYNLPIGIYVIHQGAIRRKIIIR